MSPCLGHIVITLIVDLNSFHVSFASKTQVASKEMQTQLEAFHSFIILEK